MPTTSFRNAPLINLRGAAMLLLDEVGHRGSFAGSDDGGGGAAGSFAFGTADIPCRIDPIGAMSGETGEAIDERSTDLITLPPEQVLGTTDRLLIEGRGTYEVTAVRARTLEHVREVEATEA